jgi:hypothetical protein
MAVARKSIQSLLCSVAGESERKYIPRHALYKLLTREFIAKRIDDVEEIPFYQKDKVVDWVVNNGRKVFAILVLLKNEEHHLTQFIKEDGFSRMDERLPFDTGFLERVVPEIKNDFDECQWQFVSPVLSKNIMHRAFSPRVRLPYVYSKRLGEGGFGHVYEIQLHGDHRTAELIRDCVCAVDVSTATSY